MVSDDPPRSHPSRRRLLWMVIAGVFSGVIVSAVALIFYAILGSQSHSSGAIDNSLSPQSMQELNELPYCEVAEKFDLPVELLAGVVLAEKQLNRDVTDAVQDSIAQFLILTQDENWWEDWANDSESKTSVDEAQRAQGGEWSSDVAMTGYAFSLGPAQITPRTAINACKELENSSAVCNQGVKHMVESMMDSRSSVEVAAVVLKAEQKQHLREAGIDVTNDLAKWATLYNFGGSIYRTQYAGDLNHKPNGFGAWIGGRAQDITQEVPCSPGQ